MANILLAGGTGLVGQAASSSLVEAGHKLHLVLRRKADGLPGRVQQHVASSESWPDRIADLEIDIAISCLGTTIKKAGSQEAFRAIDLHLVAAFADAAKAAGARQFIHISSTMARSGASNFYLKTKGKAEDALRALDFDRLDIIRPGLLKGDREEFRPGESFAIMLSPMLDLALQGPLRRYQSIDAAIVARCIASLADESEPGVFIHENDAIRSLAAKNGR